MSLTYRQAGLIKTSFQSIRQKMPRGSKLFYDRLFERHPEYKPLFQQSPDEQQAIMMRHLGQIVDMLAHPAVLAPHYAELAALHTKAGVSVRDFTPFTVVLIDTFREIEGDAFTFEVEVAWRAGLSEIARRMIASISFHHR